LQYFEIAKITQQDAVLTCQGGGQGGYTAASFLVCDLDDAYRCDAFFASRAYTVAMVQGVFDWVQQLAIAGLAQDKAHV
jgi:hypothetical protein